MKRILVIYYSQSGQLEKILRTTLSPVIQSASCQVDFQTIQPVDDFPFPWNKSSFFGVFPETFKQIPCELKAFPAKTLDLDYDLVILGWQTWYLSPSIPVNSFLKSKEGKGLLNGKPVITISASRNMWVLAQEKIKKLLQEANATLVGNIALVDPNPNHVSVITIVHWMMSGKQDSYLGVFPKPGIPEKTIESTTRFGKRILVHLNEGNLAQLQSSLIQKGAVKISPFLVQCDQRGNFIFSKWAEMIYRKGKSNPEKRRKYLTLFNYYLIFAIWVIIPIVFILFLLTYVPFYKKIRKERDYYQSCSFLKI